MYHGTTTPDVTSFLMRLTLERNCFEFNSKLYVQVSGTAMGTAMAPSYANLFMHELETRMLEKAPFGPYRWFRYIDDILIIRCNNQESLDQFTTYVNSFHPTIKFTKEQSEMRSPSWILIFNSETTISLPGPTTNLQMHITIFIILPTTQVTRRKGFLIPSS
jgi:hypothetical protein